MKNLPSIDDLRQAARRRVPKMFFDYADSGSYTEQTLRANRADLEAIRLRQKVLVDVSARDLSTTVLRKEWERRLGGGRLGVAAIAADVACIR